MKTSTSTSSPQQDTEAQPQPGTFALHVNGSSLHNPGPAGWAVILDAPDGTRRVLTGSAATATSNQMALWATYIALSELPADAAAVIYTDNSYVVDGLTKWRKGWARRRWRKPTGQPIANGAFWRILSATANARPGVRVVWVKVQDGDACGVLGYRLARAEAEKVRAGSEPVGGSGLILEDCADEDAAANLAWMREGEIQGDAA